jgi:hypothetical protein
MEHESLFQNWDLLKQVADGLDDLLGTINQLRAEKDEPPLTIAEDNFHQRAKDINEILTARIQLGLPEPGSWATLSMQLLLDLSLPAVLADAIVSWENQNRNLDEKENKMFCAELHKELWQFIVRNSRRWYIRANRGNDKGGWWGFIYRQLVCWIKGKCLPAALVRRVAQRLFNIPPRRTRTPKPLCDPKALPKLSVRQVGNLATKLLEQLNGNVFSTCGARVHAVECLRWIIDELHRRIADRRLGAEVREAAVCQSGHIYRQWVSLPPVLSPADDSSSIVVGCLIGLLNDGDESNSLRRRSAEALKGIGLGRKVNSRSLESKEYKRIAAALRAAHESAALPKWVWNTVRDCLKAL